MSPKSRVLIVDDFAIIRAMLRKSLNDLGIHDTTEAADGQEAFELLDAAQKEGHPYELVFIDWAMPRMTGIEVMEKCRTMQGLRDTSFIVITAERDRANLVRAMQAGALDYVMRPFSHRELAGKLENLMQNGAGPAVVNE